MSDVRWPKDWEADRDPLTGDYWAFSPTILARDVKEVPVYVPLRPNGTPDLDGLLARLRLDPVEVERLRDDWHEARSALAEIADCLNSELRGAGLLDVEADDYGDMRPVIRALVDRLHALCDRERAEVERLRAALQERLVTEWRSGTRVYYQCDECGQRADAPERIEHVACPLSDATLAERGGEG